MLRCDIFNIDEVQESSFHCCVEEKCVERFDKAHFRPAVLFDATIIQLLAQKYPLKIVEGRDGNLGSSFDAYLLYLLKASLRLH